MPQIRMDRIGEIDGRRPLGKLLAVLQFVLPFKDPSEPREDLILFRVKDRPFLIFPVGRDAFFRNLMHFVRSYLDLDLLAVGPYDLRVKGLVHVPLRKGYVVSEFPWDGLKEGMHVTQGLVTFFYRIDHDPEGRYVIDIVYIHAFQD